MNNFMIYIQTFFALLCIVLASIVLVKNFKLKKRLSAAETAVKDLLKYYEQEKTNHKLLKEEFKKKILDNLK